MDADSERYIGDCYDLCIVGAGPAGLTLAAELVSTSLKICVVESGDERRTRFADALKEAESDQLPIKESSRERMVGGASSVWGGGGAPLDVIDYEPRPWSTGWPLQAHEIAPYLEAAAQRYCFPHPAEFFPRPAEFAGDEWRGWSLQGLREKAFIMVRPAYHFAALRSIFQRNGMDLLVQTTVTELVSEVHKERRLVTEVLCKTPKGRSIRVRARAFVLAAGGIENPRRLLISNLGNEHDQVGKYFMNHPKGFAGILRLRAPLPAVSPYLTRSVGGRRFYAGLSLSPERLRTDELLNSYVRLECRLESLQHYAFRIWRRLPALLTPLCNLLRPRKLRLHWYAEMEPRVENRVTLSDKKDGFGMPLPLVSYSLGERDKKTLCALHAQLKEEIKRLGLGQIEGSAEEVIAAVRDDASHHLGGTRMGNDPASSVVDANSRVHSVENLYIAGSSVFPSGGSANPTYTIVALAIRLAEHLKRQLTVPDSASRDASSLEPRSKEDAHRSKIIIIGAGKRVAGDVLSALATLADEFSIEGIYAPHAGSLVNARGSFEVRPLGELAERDFQNTRFAYVAVPRHAVAEILELLPDRMEIILDTPAPLSPKLNRRLRRFSNVHIAEDCAYLPWLAEVRTKYAPIRRIECLQSVSRSHGIAIIKALCGPVRWGWRWGNTIHLRAGVTWVRITEPRDYSRGRLFINGNELQVVKRMHEFKRQGLVQMLRAIHRGETPCTLGEGRNYELVDWFVHSLWMYISLR